MSRLSRGLLWLFVFTVPWENVSLPWVGRATIVLGFATAGTGILTIAVKGRFRKPGLIFWLSLAFVVVGVLSSLWTVAVDATMSMVRTYLQLLAFMWLMWEFVETREQQRSLLFAFCLGMLVPFASILIRFGAGVAIEPDTTDLRYSPVGYNPNDFGLVCALTIPIAVYLVVQGRGVVRLVASICLGLAPICLALTAGRGAFLAGVVAVSIVPLMITRVSPRVALSLATFVIAAGAVATTYVPAASWNRLQTIVDEAQGLVGASATAYGQAGTLSGRVNIWAAGWQAFQERPFLGAGIGAFETTVAPLLESAEAPHSVPVALLVEQGVVGFAIFAALVGSCAWAAWRLPQSERILWMVLMLSWFVGVMNANWQYRKLTWLLFALVAVYGRHAAASADMDPVRPNESDRVDERSSGRLLPQRRRRWGRHAPTLPA